MVSKIVTIGLLGLLVIALVGGSAYILLRPSETVAARNAGGQNANGQNGAGRNSDGAVAGRQGNGSGHGEGVQALAGGREGANGSSGRQGAGRGRQAAGEVLGEGTGEHPAETWLTLNGRVVEQAGDELTLQTDDGVTTVHLGPEWYWESEGIALDQGNEVQVTGFYEGDAFEVAEIENLDTGETVSLRDDTGRPRWAGRGRARRASAAEG